MEMEGIDNELDDILSGDIGDFSVLSIFIAIFMLWDSQYPPTLLVMLFRLEVETK